MNPLYPWPAAEPEGGKDPPDDAAKKKRRGRELRIRINADRSVDVLHASDRVQLDNYLVLAGDEPTEADKPSTVWIQIGKQGAWAGHHSGRPFKLDTQVFNEIIDNFRRTQNQRIPIDFEHASEMDPTGGSIPHSGAPAQGWITDLKIDDGGNLMAAVQWGTKAREYIKAGQYMYISPAIRFGAKDRVSGQPCGARLSSAGLTNQPFLDGMLPLAAKDSDLDSLSKALTDSVTALLTDPGATSEAAASASADEEANMGTGEQKLNLSELQSANAELTLTLKAEKARAAELEKEVTELRAWKVQREDQDLKDEVEEAFLTYRDKKGYGDEDKALLFDFAKSSREAFRKMHPKVAPDKRHLLTSVATKRATEPSAPDVEKDAEQSEALSFNEVLAELQKAGKPLQEAITLAHEKVYGRPEQSASRTFQPRLLVRR